MYYQNTRDRPKGLKKGAHSSYEDVLVAAADVQQHLEEQSITERMESQKRKLMNRGKNSFAIKTGQKELVRQRNACSVKILGIDWRHRHYTKIVQHMKIKSIIYLFIFVHK